MAYKARIHQPPKNAMQSGTRVWPWVLQFIPQNDPRFVEPLMGWTGSKEAAGAQVRLTFDSLEEARAYAEKHGIPYEVILPKKRAFSPKSYAANFRFDRVRTYEH